MRPSLASRATEDEDEDESKFKDTLFRFICFKVGS
jgi:hypothetical protein